MNAEAFIIHLGRAQGRLLQVEKLHATLLLPATVIEAVDAKDLSDEDIARVYRPKVRRPRYPFALRKTEIACFLSHRKAWQTILDRDLEAGLIVEDDVEVDSHRFPEMLNFALARGREDTVIRFPEKARGEAGSVVAHSRDLRLVEPRHPGLGMQAQLVGREAAKALLAFTESFDRPVDTTIQMQWLHGVRVLRALPVVVSEVDAALGGTTIQGKSKTVGEILSREFHRTVYRFAVKAHNVLHQQFK